MILTCPDCATSYFVEGARIPPEGRTVKCSSCGARWRAQPEAEPAPEPPPPGEPELEAFEPEPAPAAPPLSPEDVEIVAEPAPVVRPARRPPPPPRKKSVAVPVFAAAAAVVALALTGAVLFREELVRAWPASAKAYAAVGLKGNDLGLVIDEVKFQPTFQGGRPVLSVTGAIRNTQDRAVTAPSLRISLLDKDGKPLAAKLARPLNADVPGGAKRYFAVALPDPPAGSASLEIAFEPEAPTAAAPPEPAAEAVLQATPVEAEPLPADSPHALPDHG